MPEGDMNVERAALTQQKEAYQRTAGQREEVGKTVSQDIGRAQTEVKQLSPVGLGFIECRERLKTFEARDQEGLSDSEKEERRLLLERQEQLIREAAEVGLLGDVRSWVETWKKGWNQIVAKYVRLGLPSSERDRVLGVLGLARARLPQETASAENGTALYEGIREDVYTSFLDEAVNLVRSEKVIPDLTYREVLQRQKIARQEAQDPVEAERRAAVRALTELDLRAQELERLVLESEEWEELKVELDGLAMVAESGSRSDFERAKLEAKRKELEVKRTDETVYPEGNDPRRGVREALFRRGREGAEQIKVERDFAEAREEEKTREEAAEAKRLADEQRAREERERVAKEERERLEREKVAREAAAEAKRLADEKRAEEERERVAKEERERLEREKVAREAAAEATRKADEAAKDGKDPAWPPEGPENKENRRKLVIRMVEDAESDNSPLAQAPNLLPSVRNREIGAKILRWVREGKLETDLALEATSRLRLHHCRVILESLPSDSADLIKYFENLFPQAASKDLCMNPENWEYFKKDRETMAAFNDLQKAAIEGWEVSSGRRIRYLGKTNTEEEDELILYSLTNHIADRLQGGTREQKVERARKYLELAESLAIAGLEVHVWNYQRRGKDPIANGIYLKESRLSEDVGPSTTIYYVNSLGGSWLREGTQVDGTLMAPPCLELKHFAYEPNDKKRYGTMNKIERLQFNADGTVNLSESRVVDCSQIYFDNLSTDEYRDFLTKKIPRKLRVQKVLTQTAWKREDLNPDNIEDWRGWFEAADPGEVKRIKVFAVVGVFSSIAANLDDALLRGWDRESLNSLLKTFTNPSSKGMAAFITGEQWEGVEKTLKIFGIRIWGVRGIIPMLEAKAAFNKKTQAILSS